MCIKFVCACVCVWYVCDMHVLYICTERCHTTLLSYLSCSPKRSPREILLDQDATINIFKQKYPKAKEEMEEKLQVHEMN